jgi:hypothetical protein
MRESEGRVLWAHRSFVRLTWHTAIGLRFGGGWPNCPRSPSLAHAYPLAGCVVLEAVDLSRLRLSASTTHHSLALPSEAVRCLGG